VSSLLQFALDDVIIAFALRQVLLVTKNSDGDGKDGDNDVRASHCHFAPVALQQRHAFKLPLPSNEDLVILATQQ
jgi:hypothetical protein